jgi:hypothetical protein
MHAYPQGDSNPHGGMEFRKFECSDKLLHLFVVEIFARACESSHDFLYQI